MSNSFFTSLGNSFSILSKQQKAKFTRLSIGLLFNTILELFSLVSFFPVLLLVLNQNNIQDNEIINRIYILFNFSSYKEFTISAILAVLFFFLLKTLFSYWILKKKANYKYQLSTELIKSVYLQLFQSNQIQNLGNHLNNIISIPFSYVNQIIGSLFDLITRIVLIILVFSGLASFDPQIFIYLLIIMAPAILISFLHQKKSVKEIRSQLKSFRPAILQKALEVAEGKEEILLSGNKSKFDEAFSKVNKVFNDSTARLITAINSSPKTIELIAISGICVLFFYFIFTEKAGEDIFLTLSVYTVASYKLIPSLNGLNVSYLNLKAHFFATEILGEIKKGESWEEENYQSEPITFNKDLELRNVSFSYPDSTFSLNNINLKIQKGKKVAIIGESGSGKSTIIQILLRFLNETSGEILVDSVRLDKQRKHSWWKQVSYVPQSVFIFEGSIKENISMQSEISDKEAQKVINNLGLDEMIHSFPNGLNSIIKEKGGNISTGQKQRLGIARALLQDREIVIFDEVTSNLDEVNQNLVIDTILRASNLGKTLIFVTHQKEIMEVCDLVFEIKSDGSTEIIELKQ